MRICESISPPARRLWWFEEGMLIGCVRQKGICELWRVVALHRGTLQEPHTFEDRLRLSLHEEMSLTGTMWSKKCGHLAGIREVWEDTSRIEATVLALGDLPYPGACQCMQHEESLKMLGTAAFYEASRRSRHSVAHSPRSGYHAGQRNQAAPKRNWA